uniref:BZIP domain-containing protein n=1 Tax=Anopheles quadriannulatus TaxID=34691 RepID=A0A182X8P9_ANOQN
MASSDNSNSFAKPLDFDDTAKKFYKALSALQRESNNIQKEDIEKLLRSALGFAAPDAKCTGSLHDTSSFLHSDDNSRLHTTFESNKDSDTRSNHSEQSASTFTSTASTDLQNKRDGGVTIMRKLHPSRTLYRWQSKLAGHHEEIPIVYHQNMARQYPATDRTPQQLDKRNRNNEAAPVSRAKSRMAEAVLEKEAEELEAANTSIKKTIASQLAYANELCTMLGHAKSRSLGGGPEQMR